MFPNLRTLLPLTLLLPGALCNIAVTNGAHGTAIERTDGDTRIYYQADDTSIRQVVTADPASGNGYSDSVILPAGIARPNTPLAAIQWNSFNPISVFYFGNALNGTHLRELTYYPDGQSFRDGDINAKYYRGAPGRQMLYVFGGPEQATSKVYRVGFACADGSDLCEAYKTDGSAADWTLRTYTS